MDLLQDVDKLVWKQEEQKAILTYSLVVKYLFNLHLVVYFTDVCGVPMTDHDLNQCMIILISDPIGFPIQLL